jgi:uncharacterized protein (DUF1778 family)
MKAEDRLFVAKQTLQTAEDVITELDEPAGVVVLVFDEDGNTTVATSLDNPVCLANLLVNAVKRAEAIRDTIADMEAESN